MPSSGKTITIQELSLYSGISQEKELQGYSQSEEKQTSPDTTGFVIVHVAAAAALDSAAFSKVNASEVIHLKWDALAFSQRGNSLVLLNNPYETLSCILQVLLSSPI
jgi:hypothetical protein